MILLYLFGALLAFALPAVGWVLWYNSRKVLYEGPADCLPFTKSLFDAPRKYALVFVQVPGHNRQLLAEISHERAQSLQGYAPVPVNVRVTQRFGGRAEIESIRFADQEAAEPARTTYPGLALSVVYLLFGLLVPISLAHLAPESGLAQHVALYMGALGIAMSGFCLNYLSEDGPVDIGRAKTSVLGLPLGKGKTGLIVLGVLMLVLTAVSFWQMSILVLIPGLHAAFALGAVTGILAKTLRTKTPGKSGSGATT